MLLKPSLSPRINWLNCMDKAVQDYWGNLAGTGSRNRGWHMGAYTSWNIRAWHPFEHLGLSQSIRLGLWRGIPLKALSALLAICVTGDIWYKNACWRHDMDTFYSLLALREGLPGGGDGCVRVRPYACPFGLSVCSPLDSALGQQESPILRPPGRIGLDNSSGSVVFHIHNGTLYFGLKHSTLVEI